MFDMEIISGRKDGGYFGPKTMATDFDSDGKLVQYFAMIEDITVKKNVAFTNRI
jgi:hypothetical protein